MVMDSRRGIQAALTAGTADDDQMKQAALMLEADSYKIASLRQSVSGLRYQNKQLQDMCKMAGVLHD